MNAKAFLIKQIRCRILRSLDLVYPSGLVITNLYQTVCDIDPVYDLNLLCKDIEYLKAKGYVEFVDDLIGGMTDYKDKVVKLTAQGLEIAQDITDDPALEI